ncbi:MAG: gluconate 2-dehydrogenase subunit 3 family protein [Acidobacteriota bacterium]
MRRRRFAQTMLALPAAPALLAQEVPRIEFGVPDAGADPVPHFFSPPQLAALRRLSDLILPALGETPGALDARAPEFLDFLIGESPADRQRLYRAGLDALNAAARKKHGKAFTDLDATQTDAVLAPLHDRWTYDAPPDSLAAFLRAAKADIMTATVNSREWIAVVSRRSRGAAGTGIYWHPIE